MAARRRKSLTTIMSEPSRFISKRPPVKKAAFDHEKWQTGIDSLIEQKRAILEKSKPGTHTRRRMRRIIHVLEAIRNQRRPPTPAKAIASIALRFGMRTSQLGPFFHPMWRMPEGILNGTLKNFESAVAEDRLVRVFQTVANSKKPVTVYDILDRIPDTISDKRRRKVYESALQILEEMDLVRRHSVEGKKQYWLAKTALQKPESKPITNPAYQAMALLSASPIRIPEIARRTRHNIETVSLWIYGFEAGGIVEKNPDLTFSLTAKGQKICKAEKESPGLSEEMREAINLSHTRFRRERLETQVARLEGQGLALNQILSETRANAKTVVRLLGLDTLTLSLREIEEGMKTREPESKRMKELERKKDFLVKEIERRRNGHSEPDSKELLLETLPAGKRALVNGLTQQQARQLLSLIEAREERETIGRDLVAMEGRKGVSREEIVKRKARKRELYKIADYITSELRKANVPIALWQNT